MSAVVPHRDDSSALLSRARGGDREARSQLLDRHRVQLRRLVELRLHAAVRRRVDPSDVVQDTLVHALRELSDYFTKKPLPFYPWLRHIALHRIARTHRMHLHTGKRSVRREVDDWRALESDEAFKRFEETFAGKASGPPEKLQRREEISRLRHAIAQLSDSHRELLELRYVEKLPWVELAAIQGCDAGAARVRHVRVIRRLRELLDRDRPGGNA